MNTREQLNQYLRGLETRLRWMTVSKGVAIAAGVALGATVALVLITNALAFSTTSMTLARVILFLSLALALGLALVLPLLRLNGRRAAGRAESEFPEFEERLLTFVERSQDEKPDPMLDLLAADTAGSAFATGLIDAEVQVEPGQLDHAVVIIDDDHAARAHDGPQRLQMLVADRRVK